MPPVGFYDFRCAISGVSLKGADAVAVALEPVDGGYRPITLGITGNYNRYGSIDLVTEDLNTELVLRFFAENDAVEVDEYHADDYGDPPEDIENLLKYFERNVSDSTEDEPALALDGTRIFATLVARTVWAAVASAYGPTDGSADTWFKDVFDGSATAAGIYGDRVTDLSAQVREVWAVNHFMAARGLAWRIPDEDEIGAQHYSAEMVPYLAEARAAFSDAPAVLAGLDAYAEEVAELLTEE